MTEAQMKSLITGTSDLSKASLATRILIGRLRIEARNQPSCLGVKIEELKAFITKNAFAAADLATI